MKGKSVLLFVGIIFYLTVYTFNIIFVAKNKCLFKNFRYKYIFAENLCSIYAKTFIFCFLQ